MALRDTRWLTLEVCREYQRGTCSRMDTECKFAHPPKSCQVENGRVVACFDSIKGRCARENCKYLHPPPHLKTQLEINGRNNLIQQKNASAIAHQMQIAAATGFMPNVSMPAVPMFSMSSGIPAAQSTASSSQFNHYLSAVSPGVGILHPSDLQLGSTVLVPGAGGMAGSIHPCLGSTPASASGSSTSGHKLLRSDRLEVCREFQRGCCGRGETECRFAHPADSVVVDSSDNTVTVCMDHMRGRCARDHCKYFHPPSHLQARIKAGPGGGQAAAAIAMGLPAGFLTTLPKRPTLDKANGATIGFSSSMLQYQQALASMQLQHQFLSPASMIPGSTAGPISAAPSPTSALQYIPSVGASQSTDTLTICRDFKSGHCARPNCRFLHLLEDFMVKLKVKSEFVDDSFPQDEGLVHPVKMENFQSDSYQSSQDALSNEYVKQESCDSPLRGPNNALQLHEGDEGMETPRPKCTLHQMPVLVLKEKGSKSKCAHSRNWRKIIKSDPVLYKTHRAAENKRISALKQSYSEEKKRHNRELQRERQRKYRLRKKEEGKRGKSRKTLRRTEKQRQLWRDQKRIWRGNMSAQKRAAINKKRRESYSTYSSPSIAHSTMSSRSQTTHPPNKSPIKLSNKSTKASNTARTAKSRYKKKLVNSLQKSPGLKADVLLAGINAQSPQSQKVIHEKLGMIPHGVQKQLCVAESVATPLEKLRKAINNRKLKTKRLLVHALTVKKHSLKILKTVGVSRKIANKVRALNHEAAWEDKRKRRCNALSEEVCENVTKFYNDPK
uniref:uncharacterized protein isoform X3 n=1 Tax=Myxine glutinosa TaxID=7769 RepID=UPI0035902FB7